MRYAEFFNRLTGSTPFPWQARVAEGPWPETLDVPTGMGKTAGVTVAWLHKRLRADPDTGRRLVYCLPMRSLVRQVAEVAVSWCELSQPFFAELGKPAPRVHLCMGGEVDASWEEDPERDTILVGTQDLLLSRALCRGYGQSRYRWPVSFGLVSNDALWIFDEPQLMGVGLETGVQLQAFRETLGTLGPCRSIFMSATLDARRFQTVDRKDPTRPEARIELTEDDRALPSIRTRIQAKKPLQRMESVVSGPAREATFAGTLAPEVIRIHQQRGGLTLVILNRVARAQAVFAALQREGLTSGELSLVHSRFRPADRTIREELLQGDGARVVVATQAVEAGLDISAKTLVTELAPFSSLVQRFGRLNRYGEQSDAAAFWLDVDLGEKAAGAALPYTESELTAARSILEGLDDVGPDCLASVAYAPPLQVRPVIRRRDLVDLFDTTPDLLGFGLDVSRYVRDSEDTDVSLFWRCFDGVVPPADLSPAHREEICRVSLGAARNFMRALAKKRKGATPRRLYRWDPLDGTFVLADRPRPGDTLLLHSEAGGYDPALGFTGKPGTPVEDVVPIDDAGPGSRRSMADDADTAIGRWIRIEDHLEHVAREARLVVDGLGLPESLAQAVTTAARWHDIGKSHETFQARLLSPLDEEDREARGEALWAKSGHRVGGRGDRPGFRHELASAIAWLADDAGEGDAQFRNLVAYLIAAHHGKVRLSIRSSPVERVPEEGDRRFARGVWDGDLLPAVGLPGGGFAGPISLDLSIIEMGEGSWIERTLALRDAPDLGPFRLACLEAVLRTSDWRASRKEASDATA